MPADHRSPWLPGALAGLVLSLDPVSRQRSAATALELCHITATRHAKSRHEKSRTRCMCKWWNAVQVAEVDSRD